MIRLTIEDEKTRAYWQCRNYLSRALRMLESAHSGGPLADRDLTSLAAGVRESVQVALAATELFGDNR